MEVLELVKIISECLSQSNWINILSQKCLGRKILWLVAELPNQKFWNLIGLQVYRGYEPCGSVNPKHRKQGKPWIYLRYTCNCIVIFCNVLLNFWFKIFGWFRNTQLSSPFYVPIIVWFFQNQANISKIQQNNRTRQRTCLSFFCVQLFCWIFG